MALWEDMGRDGKILNMSHAIQNSETTRKQLSLPLVASVASWLCVSGATMPPPPEWHPQRQWCPKGSHLTFMQSVRRNPADSFRVIGEDMCIDMRVSIYIYILYTMEGSIWRVWVENILDFSRFTTAPQGGVFWAEGGGCHGRIVCKPYILE